MKTMIYIIIAFVVVILHNRCIYYALSVLCVDVTRKRINRSFGIASDQEVPGVIPSSAIDFFPLMENNSTVCADSIYFCFSVICPCSVLCCFGRGSCSLVIKGQGRNLQMCTCSYTWSIEAKTTSEIISVLSFSLQWKSDESTKH